MNIKRTAVMPLLPSIAVVQLDLCWLPDAVVVDKRHRRLPSAVREDPGLAGIINQRDVWALGAVAGVGTVATEVGVGSAAARTVAPQVEFPCLPVPAIGLHDAGDVDGFRAGLGAHGYTGDAGQQGLSIRIRGLVAVPYGQRGGVRRADVYPQDGRLYGYCALIQSRRIEVHAEGAVGGIIKVVRGTGTGTT